jgi:membrane associated rhomboid family serine protease
MQTKILKKVYVLLALFLSFTGISLKIYLEWKTFEPRERDYALVGSFHVLHGLVSCLCIVWKRENISVPKITYPIIIAATLLLPSVGAYGISQNWDDHDRSGKYTAVMAKVYLHLGSKCTYYL